MMMMMKSIDIIQYIHQVLCKYRIVLIRLLSHHCLGARCVVMLDDTIVSGRYPANYSLTEGAS